MIIIFLLLTQTSSIQLTLLERCACVEYQQLLCDLYPYCSWNTENQICENLQCSSRQEQEICTAENSEYQCIWENEQCTTHSYECSDLNQQECNFVDWCEWQDEACRNYYCENQSTDNCDFWRCSYSQKFGCGNPQQLPTCSKKSKQDCNTSDGMGNICFYNDINQQCGEYSILQSCSQFSDIPTLCSIACTYQSQNKICQSKTCSDILDMNSCLDGQIDLIKLNYIPCVWKDEVCTEADIDDIPNFELNQCLGGAFHFTWTEQGACQLCQSVIKTNLFQYVYGEIAEVLLLLTVFLL